MREATFEKTGPAANIAVLSTEYNARKRALYLWLLLLLQLIAEVKRRSS